MADYPRTKEQKDIDKRWRVALKTVLKKEPQIAETLGGILDTGDELVYQLRAALRIEALAVLAGFDLSDQTETVEDIVESALDRIHRMREKLAEICNTAGAKVEKSA